MLDVMDLINRDGKDEGLVKLVESTAWSAEIADVYRHIATAVAGILHADQAHLHLLAIDGSRFVRCACFARDDVDVAWEDEIPSTVGRMQWMLKMHSPVVMDYENPHCCDIVPDAAIRRGVKSAVSIPLLADGKAFGMCSVCYLRKTFWGEDGLAYLLRIGRTLGAVVSRIQASKKDVELQMLDERRRLGAEIHDGTANLIGTLSVAAASVLAAYEQGDDVAVRDDLERLELLAQESMRLLRTEMLSLRTPLGKTGDLAGGIEEAVRRFGDTWGISVSFEANVSETLGVPTYVSLQLVRILNECLSNVLRHAEATNVTVSLTEEPLFLSLAVEDNGCGFDVNAVPPERLGLRIMKERTASAGGNITIMSSPNGTTVCIDIRKTF